MSDGFFQQLPLVRGEHLEVRPGRALSLAVQEPPGEAPWSIFFVHGAGGNKDQWRYQWHQLADSGHRLVAWDLLGHGASDRPKDPAAYAWDELVEDYLAVLRAYRGRRNLLVGHSFGTALTLSALARLGERQEPHGVEGVLLLGALLHSPAASGPGVLRLPAWLLEILRPLLSRGFRERAWHASVSPQLVEYEQGLTKNNRLHVFKALLGQTRWIPQASLSGLQMPVHIVAGEADRITPPQGGRELHQAIPGSTFEVLPASGHQLMLEKPDEINRRLAAFLEIPRPQQVRE